MDCSLGALGHFIEVHDQVDTQQLLCIFSQIDDQGLPLKSFSSRMLLFTFTFLIWGLILIRYKSLNKQMVKQILYCLYGLFILLIVPLT